MNTIFDKLLERSSYKDRFLNNKSLPKKYYRFPLCNISAELGLNEKIKLDGGSYERCKIGTAQIIELEYDIKTTFDSALVNSTQNKELWNWIKSWHLKNPVATLNKQKPGQLYPFHLDGMESYDKIIPDINEKKEKVRRVFIFLNDWSPGQIVMLGTKLCTNWKKGDVLWFDWYHVPHGTVNFGRNDRYLLQLTGETTPAFEKLIQNSI